jgi:hypothetical protein
MIWTDPMTKVAPRFDLSDVGLAKVCKRYDIPRPPVGYWAQKQVGKQPPQAPLPPASQHQQVIEFLAEEKVKPTDHPPQRTDRVRDEQLKALITFEGQTDNRVIVPTRPCASGSSCRRCARMWSRPTDLSQKEANWPAGSIGPWLTPIALIPSEESHESSPLMGPSAKQSLRVSRDEQPEVDGAAHCQQRRRKLVILVAEDQKAESFGSSAI